VIRLKKQNKVKEKNKKNTNIIFMIISIILTLFCLTTLSIFSYALFKVNVVPTKYLTIGYSIILILLLILIYIIFKRKNIVLRVIGLLIITLSAIGFMYPVKYLNNTYNFLEGTQAKKEDCLTYSIIVLKDSNYKKINDLKDKKLSYLNDDHLNEIKNNLKISYEENIINDLSALAKELIENKTDAIILEEGYLTLAKEEIKEFTESIKVIYTFEIKVANNEVDTSNIKISEDSFILYISGIDQYGNVNSVRGRSDVNQLAVVNPKTHHILLVNTPRDYYVQLHGTTGLKDKLTHAGIYGINKSITTMEDLYNADINYYLRVNFNTLIKVVDIIGGIDINSDKAFRAWTNKNVYVEKGWNHFNGTQALAYARERYTYLTGDHHRGQNQQQVITAIIDKVTESKVLISKYNSILNALNGSFQTDMPIDNITSFIRYQLDKMPKWTVESIQVSGYNSSNYTYSMGMNYKLYVMEPDYNSLNNAKNRIKEVLNES